MMRSCLLYTSDAADERSSVDLGGRRIIKKKKYIRLAWHALSQIEHNNQHEEELKEKNNNTKKDI